MFNDDKYSKVGRSVPNLLGQVVQNNNTTIDKFCNEAMSKHGNWLYICPISLVLDICNEARVSMEIGSMPNMSSIRHL